MPQPLSLIWSNFRPPSLTRTSREVEPASTAFSMSSFNAWTGATMISPAAILFMTSGSRALMRRVTFVSSRSSALRLVPRGLSTLSSTT